MALASKEYFNEHPKYYIHYSEKADKEGQKFGIISEMVEELKLLCEIEKEFKKNTKKGFLVTVLGECNERTMDIMDENYVTGSTMIHGFEKWDDEVKKFMKKEYPKEKVFTIYKKLEDFIIN